jgi:hypothetical protein
VNRWAVPAAVVVFSFAAVAADSSTDRQLKVEFDELASKATAAIDTVNAMEQRARADGQTLSPSLTAQRVLIQSGMDQAEEALRARDMVQLRDRLKRVRGYIERLYQML